MSEACCYDCGKSLADGGGVRREVVVRRLVGGLIPVPYLDQTEEVLLCRRCNRERGPAEEPLTLDRMVRYFVLIALAAVVVSGLIIGGLLVLIWLSP